MHMFHSYETFIGFHKFVQFAENSNRFHTVFLPLYSLVVPVFYINCLG